MFVIGTAGHVDHGKSSLVEALTGIDPDRLVEEKEREMTIDLGFAWLSLGGDALAEVGVVDVPGHRDFIENMLAGVGGIDLALLVVAADEGVMPQTREHLAILDLLQIPTGVVAITKSDLVEDSDWLELVMLDLTDTLAGTALANAPMILVSARTGAGLDELRETLAEALAAAAPRLDSGRPRLPVDRVFSLSGFGTVVTGTLVGGRLKIGDQVEIQPAGVKARIRGLQTHKTKLQIAQPGSRVAANLTGVDTRQLKRGDVVTLPGVVRGTILLDVQYRHLAVVQSPLTHNMEVKLFTGATEVVARARVLGEPQIDPGAEGWLQLRLTEPAAVSRGDRFILRRPSPAETLGGGVILDPHPGRQHRRFRPQTVARMQTLSEGTPEELLLQALARHEPVVPAKLFALAGLDPVTGDAAWQRLVRDEQVIALPGGQAMTRTGRQRLLEQAPAVLKAFHEESPLRPGMAREALRGRLRAEAVVFNSLLLSLQEDEVVVDEDGIVRLAGHRIVFSGDEQAVIERLRGRMASVGFNALSARECKEAVGEDVYFALLELGELKALNDDAVYPAAAYSDIRTQILAHLQATGRINVAGLRDRYETSRKYAIAWLEHLDETRVTRRMGDDRVLQ